MKLKKISPSLIKILKFTMFLIIPVALIAVSFCTYTIHQTKNDTFNRLNSIMNYQSEQIGNGLDQVDYYLSNTLANSDYAQDIQNGTAGNSTNPYRINKIANELYPIQTTINSGFTVYVNAPKYGLKSILRSSLDSYSDNVEVEKYINTMLNGMPSLGLQHQIQSFGDKTYYITAIQYRGLYLAAWIDIENLFSFMDSVLQSDDGFYILLDSDFVPITGSELFEEYDISISDGIVTCSLDDSICTIQSIGKNMYVVAVDVQPIDFSNSWIYLLLVLILCAVTIAFCCYIIFYFRHYIQNPLQFLQNHVNDYLKERNFTKRYGFAELDEAQNAFSALEAQVNDLKIDIYEEKLRRTKTELEFLQNQIKPHFFVNCFNIIVGMAEWEKFDEIQNFCMLLSSYVRYTLCDGFEQIPLKEELGQCRDFLEIQNIRFDSKSTITDHEDESLLSCQIPPLSLISLVENSVKYNKFKVDNLEITIDIEKIPGGLTGLLVIDYRDSGIGMAAEDCRSMCDELNQIRKNVFNDSETVSYSNAHIGIQNVYRRLLLLYGERAKMELINLPNEGFHMRITLPCSYKQSEPVLKSSDN